MLTTAKIIYTFTDEAPALASYSLLPIIRAFTQVIGIAIEIRDISLAGRIIANFPQYLQPNQRMYDHLSELGQIVLMPQANIIKLPNISASLPQLKAAIKELQDQGYGIPDYIADTQKDQELKANKRYDNIKGSAVNTILREGNSDRHTPLSVKKYARRHPHRMGAWSASSLSHVSYMLSGDFYSNEKSILIKKDGTVNIVFVSSNRTRKIIKSNIPVSIGDIIDTAVMSKKALSSFIIHQIEDAKQQGVLLSLHLKTTMMKVSDPIIFGIVVYEFYKEVLTHFNDKLKSIGFNVNNGIGDLYARIKDLTVSEQVEIKQAIDTIYTHRPKLAMVNSDKGITNLHAPNDIIIDASMPAMIRDSGKMLGPDGKFHDTKAIIPEQYYAVVYQELIENCKKNGAFDPTIIGSISNIGLMANKAEEYGSHDNTFQIFSNDIVQVQVTDEVGNILLKNQVNEGDIWRMCQTKDVPINHWIKLAINSASKSNTPAVFWLDSSRSHDSLIITKVQRYLQKNDMSKLDISILSPVEATRFSIERMRAGQNTISVTGNVLRDYLTDLFPIIELGSSAKILSIVPLMAGGSLFETGAGGSAPKHVQQFIQENHLRWDSLGELLALSASLKHISIIYINSQAMILAKTLNRAIEYLLDANKCPSRNVGELDNRDSHFYLTLFWSQALAEQNDDQLLKQQFTVLAHILTHNKQQILSELKQVQGTKVDIGGYYHPDPILTSKAMCPSATFNDILLTFTTIIKQAR